jgi:hypothetical protein
VGAWKRRSTGRGRALGGGGEGVLGRRMGGGGALGRRGRGPHCPHTGEEDEAEVDPLTAGHRTREGDDAEEDEAGKGCGRCAREKAEA